VHRHVKHKINTAANVAIASTIRGCVAVEAAAADRKSAECAEKRTLVWHSKIFYGPTTATHTRQDNGTGAP